jgi:hypothetical protein
LHTAGRDESFGSTASYRDLRRKIRDCYREQVPLTPRARRDPFLNPGNGWVSRLCFDPRVAVGVLHQLMNAHARKTNELLLDLLEEQAVASERPTPSHPHH